jgi:hypothetical protein
MLSLDLPNAERCQTSEFLSRKLPQPCSLGLGISEGRSALHESNNDDSFGSLLPNISPHLLTTSRIYRLLIGEINNHNASGPPVKVWRPVHDQQSGCNYSKGLGYGRIPTFPASCSSSGTGDIQLIDREEPVDHMSRNKIPPTTLTP